MNSSPLTPFDRISAAAPDRIAWHMRGRNRHFKAQKAFYDTIAASLDDRAFPDVQDQYDYVYHYTRKLVRDWSPSRELQELHDRLTTIAEAYSDAEELVRACVAWKTEIEARRAYWDVDTYLGGFCIQSHRDASAHMPGLERNQYFHELHDKLLEIAEAHAEDRMLVEKCLDLRLDCLLELGRFEGFLALSSPPCPISLQVPLEDAQRRLLVQQQAGLDANAMDLFSLVCGSVNPTTLDNWDNFKKLLQDVFVESAAQNGPWLGG